MYQRGMKLDRLCPRDTAPADNAPDDTAPAKRSRDTAPADNAPDDTAPTALAKYEFELVGMDGIVLRTWRFDQLDSVFVDDLVGDMRDNMVKDVPGTCTKWRALRVASRGANHGT